MKKRQKLVGIFGNRKGSILAIAAFAFVGCGGGGGGGIPSATPTPGPAQVTGKVVDYSSGVPLAGVTVSLSTWSKGAAPLASTTTASDGSFALSATSAHYLLTIGSNSPADTRATMHSSVTLSPGNNALSAPSPVPEPNVTPAASQLSGAFRLISMNANEQDCLAGMNQGRAAHGLSQLVPDEYLLELDVATNEEEAAQGTDTPSPLFGADAAYFSSLSGFFGPDGGTTSGSTGSGFSPCDTWTDGYSFTAGNPPYQFATNASEVWYGGSEMGNFGSQDWMQDPRT